jgi:hypothetical protein
MMANSRSKRWRSPRACRGLTLVEMLLAMSGTGLVGVAIATMLVAVAYGTQSDKDMRTLVVKHKTLDARLSAAIRESQMVLDAGDDFLVLWLYDTDESEAPDLSEIRRIEWAHGVLTAYQAPDDLSDASDTSYALTDDFDAITGAIQGSAIFPGRIWGVGIVDLSIALNDIDPRAATLVSYRFTLQAGDLTDAAINAVALRN